MRHMTDIDIDVPDRDTVLSLFKHIPASLKNNKHATGVYFHEVPINPFTGRCTIDFREADDMGFFKVDLINVTVYQEIESREHLKRLVDEEPDWTLFENPSFCENLFQLKHHGKLVAQMKPRSIQELAAILAIIRPGKKHLAGQPWELIMKEVWKPNEDGEYGFKRSHATSYALVVVAQMNLLKEKYA